MFQRSRPVSGVVKIPLSGYSIRVQTSSENIEYASIGPVTVNFSVLGICRQYLDKAVKLVHQLAPSVMHASA